MSMNTIQKLTNYRDALRGYAKSLNDPLRDRRDLHKPRPEEFGLQNDDPWAAKLRKQEIGE